MYLCFGQYKTFVFPAVGKMHGVQYFTMFAGITLNAHVEFLEILSKRVSGLHAVHSVDQCDVILLFAPVVSRVGTDIQEALRKLTDLHGNAYQITRGNRF